MKTLVSLSDDLQAELSAVASRFFGERDCKELCKDLAARIGDQFPNKAIEVVHIEHAPDLRVPLIRLLVIVDGNWDQGLMFTKPPAEKPAP